MGKILKRTAGLAVAAVGVLGAVQWRDSRKLDRIWQSLDIAGSREPFAEDMVADLPAPVQRYFLHAIEPGTPLVASVQFTMSGSIRNSAGAPWMPLTARQVLTPHHGFVWRAKAQQGPLLMTVKDHYSEGEGRMRIELLGLVPFVNATGPDLSKSALGRLVAESFWVPATLLPRHGVSWKAVDDEHIQATFTVAGETSTLELTIDADGQVREIVLPRRWNADDREYVPFGGVADEERTFAGYTIPSAVRIGWGYGTDDYVEGIRLTLETAAFW